MNDMVNEGRIILKFIISLLIDELSFGFACLGLVWWQLHLSM